MAEEDSPQRETDGALACRGCRHAGGVRSGADTRAGAPLLRHLQSKPWPRIARACLRCRLTLGCAYRPCTRARSRVCYLLAGGILPWHATQPRSVRAQQRLFSAARV
jgi:hypothetical protein